VEVENARDVQLDRADDLLKAILLYGKIENAPEKVATK
jgi:hypothetical protein